MPTGVKSGPFLLDQSEASILPNRRIGSCTTFFDQKSYGSGFLVCTSSSTGVHLCTCLQESGTILYGDQMLASDWSRGKGRFLTPVDIMDVELAVVVGGGGGWW